MKAIIKAALFALALAPAFAHAQWNQMGTITQMMEPTSRSNSTYNSGDALRGGGTALMGTVINARQVQMESGTGRTVGTTIGALGGGLIAMGRSTSYAAQSAGAAIGGVVGYLAGGVTGRADAVELLIRLADGKVISLVQQVDNGDTYAAGAAVAVVLVNGRLRAVRT